ncbi:MAG: hypothetical protein NVS4B11_04920 [Ktedonobacteraceae bacterium]
MLAIATNALYTTVRRRGTTRQLASVIVVCVICALLLLPAVVWYTIRFNTEQSALSLAEVQVVLAYVVLCGWFLPLSVTTSYCLFTPSRLFTTSVEIPRQKRRTRLNPTTALHPPRHQPGVPAPFVFNEETPWGWLEYRSGSFQGQRLALKRAVVTIGRDEENDIWIDDDMASRHHAELAWNEGTISLTDCDSLNGVLLNGKRIAGSVEVKPENLLEVGSQRFIFLPAEKPEPVLETFDPLSNHRWLSSLVSFTTGSNVLPATRLLQDKPAIENIPTISLGDAIEGVSQAMMNEWQDTALLNRVTPLPIAPEGHGALLIQNGELMGKTVLLDRPVITVGRGIECNIVINDTSISRQHAQFSRQTSGDYVQDLTSRNGTLVNNEPLIGPQLLHKGDCIRLGTINLEYIAVLHERMTPLPYIVAPQSFARSSSGPMPLKLPSKQKEV